MAETLEAIAQAIFKEWFVDFNFPSATGEMVEREMGVTSAITETLFEKIQEDPLSDQVTFSMKATSITLFRSLNDAMPRL